MNIDEVKELVKEIRANATLDINGRLIIDSMDLGRVLSLRLAGEHPMQPPGSRRGGKSYQRFIDCVESAKDAVVRYETEDGALIFMSEQQYENLENPPGLTTAQPPFEKLLKKSSPPCIMWRLKDAVQIKSELIRQVEFREEGKELFVYECYFMKAKK